MTTKIRKIKDMLNVAEKMFGYSEEDIFGKSRKGELVIVRHACQALCAKYRFAEAQSLVAIGLHFGGRDHATIINAIKRVEEALESPRNNPPLRSVYNALLLECDFSPSKVLKTELSIYGISAIIRQYGKLNGGHIQKLLIIRRAYGI